MQYFRPRNWEKFQHYKDRSPPWIKLHKQLLRDPEFLSLTPYQQATLIKLWLLYADTGRPLRLNTRLTAGALAQDSRGTGVALKHLLSHNFIELCSEDDSRTLAARKQVGPLETETETETQERKITDDAREMEIPSSLDRRGKQAFHAAGDRVLSFVQANGAVSILEYSRVDAWLEAGFDIDLDIMPTIKATMQRKRDGPPHSLKYFDQAISDAHKTRTTPPPEGRLNGQGTEQNREPTNTDNWLSGLAKAARKPRADSGEPGPVALGLPAQEVEG